MRDLSGKGSGGHAEDEANAGVRSAEGVWWRFTLQAEVNKACGDPLASDAEQDRGLAVSVCYEHVVTSCAAAGGLNMQRNQKARSTLPVCLSLEFRHFE